MDRRRPIKLTQPVNQGKKIHLDINKIEIYNFQHPIFCFKYLTKDFHLDKCIPEEQVSLINQIVAISQLTWAELQFAPKHGMGSEKIARNSIKAGMPDIVTDDVDHFLAFRFHGKAPFVGIRNRFIFHVIYVDRGYNLYKH